jgi:hypothetical protein
MWKRVSYIVVVLIKMKKLVRRQILISIFVGLLAYGLACYGLSFTITRSIQRNLSSSALSDGIPLFDWKSYNELLTVWQVNEGNIIPAQIVVGRNLCRVFTGCGDTIWNATCSHIQNVDSDYISSYLIDRPEAIFKLAKGQACQHLDIPPPPATTLL